LFERVTSEIQLLKERYPNLKHGADLDWVSIPDFPLPVGYNRANTRLMFLIPSTYPHTGPDCFYVDVGLRLASGDMPSNYNEHMNVPVGDKWGYFSWHPEVWEARDQINEGDNLVTFIRAINVRLREEF
jgi:hypothetical protein